MSFLFRYRRVVIGFSIALAAVGLLMIARYQRAQNQRVDRNSRQIAAVVKTLKDGADHDHAAARKAQTRAFNQCVRGAVLRRHVNLSTTTLRRLLKESARGRTLTATQTRQLHELLVAFTIAPGPETRKDCLRVSPPPPPEVRQ